MTATLHEAGTQAPVGAMSAERLHAMLRAMADEDWRRLKVLMAAAFPQPEKEQEIDILERLFRKGEAIARQAGGTVLRIIHAIIGDPLLLDEVRRANERVKGRVRFVLREMSADDWLQFRGRLQAQLGFEATADEIVLLELVFRMGESVSNVEVAAQAKAAQLSGKKLLTPEVARKNALMKAPASRRAELDPDAVYEAAKEALEAAQETARRGAHTLAAGYVQSTAAFKHARNTLFKLVDSILENGELMREITRIEQELLSVPGLTREQLRWALHRMPMPERLQVIQLIPLNTILMFQEGDLELKATRDRRLACDVFVNGHSDDELAANYGFSLNAVKNSVGTLLLSLLERPSARKLALDYLNRVAEIAPFSPTEVRRRMKRLNPDQRAELVQGIPYCAWKVRQVSQLHKHLFLDYYSGEWVMATLVDYYNRHKAAMFAGRSFSSGLLTLRGATAALEGIIHKISEEPELCHKLRLWTEPRSVADSKSTSPGPNTSVRETVCA